MAIENRSIDELLADITGAVGRTDWHAVMKLAQDILAIESDNDSATLYLKLAQKQVGSPAGRGQAKLKPMESSKPVPSKSLPSSFVGGRYVVKEFLGEGIRKKVYLAHDTTLDRDVAFALIKTEGLDADARKRVMREGQVMGRLGTHPNIVTVHDMGRHDVGQYVVMELMERGDVADALSAAPENRLSLDRVLAIGKAVLRGLSYAHSKGVIHRDIKASNVWLAAEGTVKIGDFGLALTLDRSRITQENVILGTVAYLSPEQATGAGVTERSDLYSVGVLLYEMVTGRPPFLGDDDVAIIGQHINTPPVAPTWHRGDCPRPLEALILRLLSKDPKERPASAEDVLKAVEAVDLAASGEAVPEEGRRALDSVAGGVFVGRRKEMGRLKACMEEVLSGRGRLVMLVGEPGIGKTRTAEELKTYAGLRGAQVLWGRCYEAQGAPPYWPWIQAVRSYVRECSPKRLSAEMGSGGGVIAELIGDVREKLPDLPKPVALEDPESSRFRLFDAVTTFLKSASEGQPLVIVLDDLHWADTPTLVFLEFAAHELSGSRLLVLGTYRDVELRRTHPLQKTLGDLTRERLFERVLLRGLSEEDVGRFIELASGTKPPQELVSAVYTHTEGNPLFVTEVVRLLVQRGDLRPEEASRGKRWSLGIPEGVREVIGRRLDNLSARCNEVLTVAAVVGRSFTAELLTKLVEDISEDRLLEVLEEALAARVLEELPDAVGSYQFTHSLVQQTLLEELTTTRKVRLHARIAEQLEGLYGEEAEAHAAELVRHFAEAETVLGPEKLARYSLLAGQEALDNYAYDDALGHFERGMAAAEGRPMDDQKAELEFGLGRALGSLERADAAVEHIARAFDYFEAAGNVRRAVAAAEYPFWNTFNLQNTYHLVDRAMKLVEPDSHEAGMLLYKVAYGKYVSKGDYDGIVDLFTRALEIARRENDTGLEMRILWYWTHTEASLKNRDASFEKASRAIELTKTVDDPRSEIWCRMWTIANLELRGDFDAVDVHCRGMIKAAEKLRESFLLALALAINACRCIRQGQWQAARGYNDRIMALHLKPSHYIVFNQIGARARLEYETGNASQGYAFLARFLKTAPEVVRSGHIHMKQSIAAILPTIGRITGNLDHLDLAESAAKATLPDIDSRGMKGLGLIAVLRGDENAASEIYDALGREPFSNAWVAVGYRRLLGLLDHTAGRPDAAAGHFEDSLAWCRKAGHLPEVAWTCCDFADLLLQRRGPGDVEKSRILLSNGHKLAEELGMPPLRKRIEERLEKLKEWPRFKPSYPNGLTVREVEVLRLVVKGFTNKEIAGLLHISAKTVATHLAHVFEKADCANRAEATAYAVRQGLTEE